MTPAERQRRRRKRLKKERTTEAKRLARLMRRDKNALAYIPAPPGITYWRQVTVLTNDGEKEIWTPTTRPLATCGSLEDDELQSLIRQLHRIARKRGLAIETESGPIDDTAASLLQVRDVDHKKVTDHMAVFVGPRP